VPADERLEIYLNDHLAGSLAGIRLARRCLSREQGTGSESERFLTTLVEDIDADRAVLEHVMELVGARPNELKKGGALVVETLARVRQSMPLIGAGSEEVGAFEELELLSLGIEGKRLLWSAVRLLADERLAPIDLSDLEERARRQRDGLEKLRLTAAVNAFGRDAPRPG
jgi:hypothetical protein